MSAAGMPGTEVRLELERPLPSSLPPETSSAVFLYGHCFGVRKRVRTLRLVAGESSHRPTAMGMPRPDLLERLGGSQEDPQGHSYRSGFWATVPVHARSGLDAVELSAEVTLEGGATIDVKLAQIPVANRLPPASLPGPVEAGTVAVCMATFDPRPELIRAQIDSLRAQSDDRWVCLISDGGSCTERFDYLEQLVAGDARFVLSRSEQRLGPYQNFERALRMVPDQVELVALSDQDDRWYPEKLAVLRAELGRAELVYSDLRWVTPDGKLVRDSLWRGRRNDYRNLASLLVANTVPGAAMLFHRRLLDRALPFPDPPGVPYHDHWLALVALASGELHYVDRPLYDWVQHTAAVSRRAPDEDEKKGASWRGAYFGGYLMRDLQARTLLERCAPLLGPGKRRALERFVSAAGSPPSFLWLALRPLRRFVGRGETLGGEVPLAQGIAWRWLIDALSFRARRPRRLSYSSAFPNPTEFRQRGLERWRSGS